MSVSSFQIIAFKYKFKNFMSSIPKILDKRIGAKVNQWLLSSQWITLIFLIYFLDTLWVLMEIKQIYKTMPMLN